VTRGRVIVYLQSIAKLERSFLKPGILQISFALAKMLGSGFSGIRAATEGHSGRQKKAK
jgi:hypothetical protein